jgi:hypothetical protein
MASMAKNYRRVYITSIHGVFKHGVSEGNSQVKKPKVF